jgi:hypothetical protein
MAHEQKLVGQIECRIRGMIPVADALRCEGLGTPQEKRGLRS